MLHFICLLFKIIFLRTFVICLCGTGDAEDFCDCPGEVRFGKELEDEGMIILFPLFVDPLTQENWKVVLLSYDNVCKKTLQNKFKPLDLKHLCVKESHFS